MAEPKYQHTVQLPADLEAAWKRYQQHEVDAESFNAFVLRLIREEMLEKEYTACVTDAPILTTQ